MSGFGGFGTPPAGGLFGAKPPEKPATGFALPTTTQVTTTASAPFGTPTFGSGGTSLFGSQMQSPTFGTGFGLKPTTTAGTTGFTFGTSTTTTLASTFGTSTTTTLASTFGTSTTTTSAPAFSATSTNTAAPKFGTFGTSNAPAFGTTAFNAGSSKTTSTSLTFPTAGTVTAAPTFNFSVTTVPTTTPSTLTFGISATTTPITTSATTTTTTSATTSLAPTLSFGVPNPGISSIATSTSTTTTAATGFTLTQPSTTSSLTFGVSKTTEGFTFGTSTTKTLTFNLGTTTTTTPTLNAGLFGAPKTTQGISITTTTTASPGLGGVDNTQTTQGLSGTSEPKQAKDHTLPDPILQTLNEFQTFTKQQKSLSVEISHGSSKPLKKVQEDTEAMESLLTTITSGLTKNAIAVEKLKTETAQGLHQAEMAQRNHETPPGLEYDNSAPSDYFNDLVTKFETDTVRLRVQIEASEKHLKSLTQCSTISPQELTLAMRRLHETLIVLAARVQALHTTVQSQKEQFKNLRRVYFKDDTNVFESETDQARAKKQTIYSLRSLAGPTPFSETPGTGLPLNVDGLAMLVSSAASSIPTTSTNLSWMSPLQGSHNAGFSTPGVLGNFSTVEVSQFQLSKPPTGNKRSKR